MSRRSRTGPTVEAVILLTTTLGRALHTRCRRLPLRELQVGIRPSVHVNDLAERYTKVEVSASLDP